MGGDLSLGGPDGVWSGRGSSSVGPSRGPPRTGHWASRGPRRKRRAPGPSPVPGHDGDDGVKRGELGLAVSRLTRGVWSSARGSEG